MFSASSGSQSSPRSHALRSRFASGLYSGVDLTRPWGISLDPIRPPDLIEVRRVFAEPIGAPETIARYIGKLVMELCEALATKGLGARRLDLLFHRVDVRIEAIRIGTATPVRDVKRLTRLLCDKIETVEPGFGIEIMRLAATRADRARCARPQRRNLAGLRQRLPMGLHPGAD